MQKSTSSQLTGAAYAAYSAALLFALHLLTYFIPVIRDATFATSASLAGTLAFLAVVQHLVVFPVVATLPAPRWAKVAAYVWLVVDMCTDILQFGGVSKAIYLVLRLAVNLLAALWIASASWPISRAIRYVGVFVALDFACYSFVALLSPLSFLVALPSLVLLPVWFGLVGRLLAHREKHRLDPAEKSSRQATALGQGKDR